MTPTFPPPTKSRPKLHAWLLALALVLACAPARAQVVTGGGGASTGTGTLELDRWVLFDGFDRPMTRAGIMPNPSSPAGGKWYLRGGVAGATNDWRISNGKIINTNVAAETAVYMYTSNMFASAWTRYAFEFTWNRGPVVDGQERGIGFIIAPDPTLSSGSFLHCGFLYSGFYIQSNLTLNFINTSYPAALPTNVPTLVDIIVSGNTLLVSVGGYQYTITAPGIGELTQNSDNTATWEIFGSTNHQYWCSLDAVAAGYAPHTYDAGAFGFRDSVLTPSSHLTNYTIISGAGEYTVNMTNAVRFTQLSGGIAGTKQFPCITLTNYSGSAQSLDFTNTWTPYGSFTNSIAAGKTARVCFEVEGANVRYNLSVSP